MSKDEQDDKIVYLIDRKSLSPQGKRLFSTNWLRKEITKVWGTQQSTAEETNIAVQTIADDIHNHFDEIDDSDHLITALLEFAILIGFTTMQMRGHICKHMAADAMPSTKLTNETESIT